MLEAMSDPTILFIAAVFALAGLVKGVIGLGLPTVSMGLLAMVMPPVQAAAVLVLPSLVTNLWQMMAGPALTVVARRLWPMMTWSTTSIPSSFPASTQLRVTMMSSGDGDGSPEGWLCETTIAAAFCRSASLNTSATRMTAVFRLPL